MYCCIKNDPKTLSLKTMNVYYLTSFCWSGSKECTSWVWRSQSKLQARCWQGLRSQLKVLMGKTCSALGQWPLAGLNSLIVVSQRPAQFSYMWPPHMWATHTMAAGLPQLSLQERGNPRQKLPLFYNRTMRVNSYHLCCILLIWCESVNSAPAPGMGFSQGVNTSRQGCLQASYKATYCMYCYVCHFIM